MSYFDDVDFKTIGMSVGAGLFFGYCFGSRSTKSKSTIIYPDNTFWLFDYKDDSVWDYVFSAKTNLYENLYNSISQVPDHETINIVIKTHGGSVYWCEKICRVIRKRIGKVRIFIKDYAHSAGSVIALAADEVFMNKYATMSAIDPQVDILAFFSYLPLKDVGTMIKSKDDLVNHMQDNSKYYNDTFRKLIHPKHDVNKIMGDMYEGVVDHNRMFDIDEVRELGIKIVEWDGKNVVSDEEEDEKAEL